MLSVTRDHGSHHKIVFKLSQFHFLSAVIPAAGLEVSFGKSEKCKVLHLMTVVEGERPPLKAPSRSWLRNKMCLIESLSVSSQKKVLGLQRLHLPAVPATGERRWRANCRGGKQWFRRRLEELWAHLSGSEFVSDEKIKRPFSPNTDVSLRSRRVTVTKGWGATPAPCCKPATFSTVCKVQRRNEQTNICQPGAKTAVLSQLAGNITDILLTSLHFTVTHLVIVTAGFCFLNFNL